MESIICPDCKRSFNNSNALYCHRYRQAEKKPEERCGFKEEAKKRKAQEAIEQKEKKKQAKTILANLDVTDVVAAVEQQTNHDKLMDKMDELLEENKKSRMETQQARLETQKMSEKCDELKEMVTEFARNPQLLILVDKLYPLSSLRELDLKTPAFKPVLEILDKELPEYPNLVNDETGKVHCKAVKKLNEIQPTVVKDDEKLFYKKGDVLTRGSGEEATKEFIDVIANSGYEYAQKASKDLKSRRESDKDFKRGILKNAACHASIQDVTDI